MRASEPKIQERPVYLAVLPLVALLLLVGAACAPQNVRVPGAAASAENTTDPNEAAQIAEDTTSIPAPPPAPKSGATLSAVREIEFSGGTRVCAAERPDLAWPLLSLEGSAELRPELLLLLREWFTVELEKATGTNKTKVEFKKCGRSLLCLALRTEDEPTIVLADLARALSRPGRANYFAARARALSLAEEMDATDADFKLMTSAVALREVEPARLSLRETTAQDWDAFLKPLTGAGYLRKLSLPQAEQAAQAFLNGSTLVVAGSFDAAALAARLSEKKDELAGSVVERSLAASESPVTRPSIPPVELTDYAGESSEGAYVRLASAGQEASTVGLYVLLERLGPPSALPVRAEVRAPGGLYSHPSLRLSGSLDSVRVISQQLASLDERLRTASDAPTKKEIDRGKLAQMRATAGNIEARCLREKVTSPLAPAALQEGAPPLALIWGDVSPTVSE